MKFILSPRGVDSYQNKPQTPQADPTRNSRIIISGCLQNPKIKQCDQYQGFDVVFHIKTLYFFNLQYIVTNSVEERMLTLQEQKRELMGQAFGLDTQSQEDRRRARVRDIKHLIGL